MTEREKQIDQAAENKFSLRMIDGSIKPDEDSCYAFAEGVRWSDANPSPQLKERLEAADEMAESLEELLEQFEDDCRFDHNGNCQEHLCFAYDHSCHVDDAKKRLQKYNATKEG